MRRLLAVLSMKERILLRSGCLAFLCVGCGDADGEPDAGAVDGAPAFTDASATGDGGRFDAAPMDASRPDGALTDAALLDGGGVDGGGADGGADAGPPPPPPDGICSADGWCAVHPTPTVGDLYDVWGTSDTNVFAVGERG